MQERYTEVVAKAWLAAALFSSSMGLMQYFGVAHLLSPWVNTATAGEAFGNLRQRNQFATLTSIGLGALMWHVSKSSECRQGRSFLWSWRTWGAAAAILLALGNAASGSRTGLFQWCIVAGLVLLWWRAAAKAAEGCVPDLKIGLFAVGFYATSAVFLPIMLEWSTGFKSAGLIGRFKDEAGCQSRGVLWSNVLYLIEEKPWLGWGWGELDYAHFVTLYPGPRFCDILDNAHNLPLHVAVEFGVPAASLLCGLMGWLVWRAKPWIEVDPTRQLAWIVFVVIGFHSMVEYPLWYGPFQMAFGLCLWIFGQSRAGTRCCRLWAVIRRYKISAVACGAFIVAMAFALLFAAWDYWRISQLYVPADARTATYRDNTLEKVRGTVLFRDQVEFAELTTSEVVPENAAYLYAMAKRLLHFSPEPRVIQKLIASALQLGLNEEALYYQERFQAAFPEAHAAWLRNSGRDITP
jgi:hypothetical protein